MRVRHSKEALHGQPPENAFIAYDEDERPVGACSISAQHKPVLYPEQPYRIYIRTEGRASGAGYLAGRGHGALVYVDARGRQEPGAHLHGLCAGGFRKDGKPQGPGL